MEHVRADTPAYLIWVEARPTFSGKGKDAYYQAVRDAACRVVEAPISTSDIAIKIVYSTTVSQANRLDTNNVNKPTLDALKGVAYGDDSQVHEVSSTVIDRNKLGRLRGRVEHMGRLLFSERDHVVLIMVYSDSRLKELGGEKEVQRRRYEEWQREFDELLEECEESTV